MAGREMNRGPTAETVRQNIAFFRKNLGLTYADLSRDLERRGHPIPPLGLRRIEAGERRVDVDDLAALALALNVNPNALLLPRTKGRTVLCSVTGYDRGTVNTEMVWEWARGVLSLSTPSSAGRPETHASFRDRARPREVLTDEDRADRRARWLRFEIAKLEEDMENAHRSAQAEGDDWDGYPHLGEIAELRELDPADDAQWARMPFDPAPPSTTEVHDA